jgi:hemerythrin-like domain-containing protein
MPVQIGASTHGFNEPMGLLSDCHRRIEMFLRALKSVAEQHGATLTDEARQTLASALRYFREAAPKHNADEEESLFPRLRAMRRADVNAALAEVDKLEQDHRWAAPLHAEVDHLGERWLREGRLGRPQAERMIAAMDELLSMYARHIELEEQVVFPLAARVLPAKAKAEIAAEMAARRGLAPAKKIG